MPLQSMMNGFMQFAIKKKEFSWGEKTSMCNSMWITLLKFSFGKYVFFHTLFMTLHHIHCNTSIVIQAPSLTLFVAGYFSCFWCGLLIFQNVTESFKS